MGLWTSLSSHEAQPGKLPAAVETEREQESAKPATASQESQKITHGVRASAQGGVGRRKRRLPDDMQPTGRRKETEHFLTPNLFLLHILGIVLFFFR